MVRLQCCENFFETLRQENGITIDEEANFMDSAKRLREILDTKFPQILMNSDRTRVTMIVSGYKPAAITNVDKIIKLIDRVVDSLIRVEYSLSELIEYYNGLKEELESAIWLRDWLRLGKEERRYDTNEFAKISSNSKPQFTTS